MAGFIARQPNGLLCRHSTIVDCVTDYNMTEEDYINLCIEKARKEAGVKGQHDQDPHHKTDEAKISWFRVS